MKYKFVCIVLVVNVFLLSNQVKAGIISGTVEKNNETQENKKICIKSKETKKTTTITTNDYGKYEIFLKPGHYEIWLNACDEGNSTNVQSYRGSTKIDLQFQ